MHRAIAKFLFLTAERLRGERVGQYLRELESNQRLSPHEIRAIQTIKRNRLLNYVSGKNDYYRTRFAGIDPISEFASLPILDKQELRDRYQDLVTTELAARTQLIKTSGSTGKPLKMYRDKTVFGYNLASVYRAHRWHGLDIGCKEAMLWGIPNALKDRLKMHARDFALNRFREREYNLDPLVLAGFCQKLRNKKPDYLYGYSSMIYEFALFLHERGINARDFGLKAVFYSAESLHPYQRDLIEAVFGCTVAGEYGAAETGVITFQCPSGKHHIADDCVLVELLDERGREVSVGQIGRVTVTVLHSFSAPIIRYQLGDLATKTSDPCSCGISLSVLDGIVGRTAGIILTPSGRCFHSISVYYIMKEFTAKFGSIRQFRVVQPCLDKLEFHMAVQQGFGEQAERWLERRVWQTFGPDMRVTFQMHETIPRSPSGKLSDFESRLDTRTQLLASFRLGDVGQVD